MILIISTCKEKLHELEFVKPIEDILKNKKMKFIKKNYLNLNQSDINKSAKIIITGTSLKDNGFLKHLNKFKFIKTINTPILGICAGMHIIGLIFNGNLKKHTEIGFYNETINQNFLSLKKDNDNGFYEFYHLHNNYVDFSSKKLKKHFNILIKSNYGKHINQAIKHKTKQIYGVLFHPEVRQKHLIINFCSL